MLFTHVTPSTSDSPPTTPGPSAEITVYWRPGCPFCGSLFRQLERESVPHRRVNIWDDPAAAAIVRAVANGHETVPTVVIGGVGGVGLVNPRVSEIMAVAARP